MHYTEIAGRLFKTQEETSLLFWTLYAQKSCSDVYMVKKHRGNKENIFYEKKTSTWYL